MQPVRKVLSATHFKEVSLFFTSLVSPALRLARPLTLSTHSSAFPHRSWSPRQTTLPRRSESSHRARRGTRPRSRRRGRTLSRTSSSSLFSASRTSSAPSARFARSSLFSRSSLFFFGLARDRALTCGRRHFKTRPTVTEADIHKHIIFTNDSGLSSWTLLQAWKDADLCSCPQARTELDSAAPSRAASFFVLSSSRPPASRFPLLPSLPHRVLFLPSFLSTLVLFAVQFPVLAHRGPTLVYTHPHSSPPCILLELDASAKTRGICERLSESVCPGSPSRSGAVVPNCSPPDAHDPRHGGFERSDLDSGQRALLRHSRLVLCTHGLRNSCLRAAAPRRRPALDPGRGVSRGQVLPLSDLCKALPGQSALSSSVALLAELTCGPRSLSLFVDPQLARRDIFRNLRYSGQDYSLPSLKLGYIAEHDELRSLVR